MVRAGPAPGRVRRIGQVIGDLLPLALGVAISPVPIIAVILMLLAPRAGGTSAGFLAGWVAGILVATVALALLAALAGLGDGGGSSSGPSWVKIGLGVLLVLLAGRQWRARPHEGRTPELPGWMAAVDTFTPVEATGLGFALAAVNPKNLALAAGAGLAVGTGGLSTGAAVVAVVVFAVIAASTVAIPVLGYAVAAERMTGPLDALRRWLLVHNAAVTTVLLLVIGVALIGKGVGGF